MTTDKSNDGDNATSNTDVVSQTIESTVEIVDQMSEYGSLITNSLYMIIFGMIAVFIIHKLVSKFIYPMLNQVEILLSPCLS